MKGFASVILPTEGPVKLLMKLTISASINSLILDICKEIHKEYGLVIESLQAENDSIKRLKRALDTAQKSVEGWKNQTNSWADSTMKKKNRHSQSISIVVSCIFE